VQDYRELQVCQKGDELAVEIYRITNSFPREEIYGLTNQLRRASVSIPANIAEGCGRSGRAELWHFLRIAIGSASELECLLMLCRDIKLIDSSDWEGLADEIVEIRKMLMALQRSVKSKS